jgi:hypothetical protein
MPETYQAYNCFISSPNDVKDERQIAENVINRINRSFSDTLSIILNIKKWELMSPVAPIPEERIQDIINREVERSHFFILILYKRYGTVEKGYSISNTERELNTIIDRYQKRPQLKILAYFRELAPNEDPGEQEQKVKDFRNRLETMNIMHKSYKNAESFKDELTHDLYDTILRMRIATFKSRCLNRFWQFGEINRSDIPRLAIMYPPISRAEDLNIDDNYWINNLVPSLFFEDHKAVEKIRKTFNIIGFHDYTVYPAMDLPDWKRINRVWLSLPRFLFAQQQLQKYSKISRVTLGRSSNNHDFCFKWKNKEGNEIEINSPLSKYLIYSRKDKEIYGDWHHELGRIVVKDFGIITRFRDPKSPDILQEGYLHDYFITGLHGLGTWGAAWFIDRQYKCFSNISVDEDFQILVEITYKDNKMFEVQDVSDLPNSYFIEQNSSKYIKKLVSDHQQ